MDYKDVREKLFSANNEESKAEALMTLDDFQNEFNTTLEDLKAANAKLFSRYGQVGEMDEDDVENVEEIEDVETVIDEDSETYEEQINELFD